jgi:hypothetical protein
MVTLGFRYIGFSSVADPDPVGSGPFWSAPDPDPDVWDRIRIRSKIVRIRNTGIQALYLPRVSGCQAKP